MKKNRTDKINKIGISLISLIITIIVIIILAAIVIFTGLGTPDRANFAKFTSKLSDFRTAVTQDYMEKKAEYAINGISRSDAQIYYIIASGKSTDDVPMDFDPNTDDGTTVEISTLSGYSSVQGEYAYLVTNDTNVKGWKTDKGYYEPRSLEQHYITDKGDVFITPGYMMTENGTTRWYVNEKSSYESETPIRGPKAIMASGVKITKDQAGNTIASDDSVTPGSQDVYITFVASVDGGTVTVGSVPTGATLVNSYSEGTGTKYVYKVSSNGTYNFGLTTTAEGVADYTYPVTVRCYDVPTLAKKITNKELSVGDYIYYDPDSTNTYTTTVEYAGVAQSLSPGSDTNKVWRVWDISGGKITIVPNTRYTNAYLSLRDVQGYVNGAKIVNDACKALFTNSTLGVTSSDIRSMTIEDINAVYDSDDGVPMYNDLKYLFYQGTSATPSAEKVEAGYTAKSHSVSTSYSANTGYRKFFFPKDINGNTISGFADMEGGTSGTTDGMSYIAISGVNPVYVKNTLRYSSPSSWKLIGGEGRNSTANYESMLPYYSWLASPYVSLKSSDSDAYFGLQGVGSSLVRDVYLYCSDGFVYSLSYALRPLVSLSSTLPVVSGAGTSASPYKLQ